MSTAADPRALADYARVAEELDPLLRRLADRVTDPMIVVSASPGARWELDELAAGLGALAEREAVTGRWVAAVSHAFAAADSPGPGPAPASVTDGLVDLYVRLATDGHDPSVAAEAIGALVAAHASPARVRGAVRALGPVELGNLVARRPDLVGPVDGMPPSARYTANRLLVSSAATHAPDPATARRFRAFLADDRSLARPARDLQQRAGRASAGRGVAVVAWLGYDPPDGLVVDVSELGALLSGDRARAGGRALATMLDGIGLRPGQAQTLIGHSYGSTTVAAALLSGARADNVVMLGSPGVLVDHARQFGLPATDFFTMAAPGDPVAHLGWFGGDPNRWGSGFRRLASGGRGHSAYLVAGSTAQANLVAVIGDRNDQFRTVTAERSG